MKKLARVPDGGGHKTLGRTRSQTSPVPPSSRLHIHTANDAYSRLAYSEFAGPETAQNCVEFLGRVITFAAQGITVERVLTDNGVGYRNYRWHDRCEELGIVHTRTRSYRPATNGKVCEQAAPELVGLFGVGTEIAAQFLVTAGDNGDRIRSEAAFAKLCGVAPQPASSGRTTGRHRLSRSGDRAANSALYMVTLVRLRRHEPTRVYCERRTAEGMTKREIIRCLKRYIAREVFAALLKDPVGTTALEAA